MIEALQRYKKQIQPHEKELIISAIKEHPLREKELLTSALVSFVQGGKHVRGGLFLQSLSWWSDISDEDLKIAASIELIHSAMLIQDDIMDGDSLRRGNASLHTQFQAHNNNRRISEGMAVCASDLLIFTTFETLSRIHPPSSTIMAKHLQDVTLGQLRDVTNDDPWSQGIEPTQQSILNLYANKTGRYTFTLPMQMAAKRAGVSTNKLQDIGKCLGIVFQLRDDELNIYGSTTQTGKPELSDVEDDELTLLRKLVREKHPEIEQYFGTDIDPDDIATVKAYFAEVKEQHTSIKETYMQKAHKAIDESMLPDSSKEDLHTLTSFVAQREK